MTTTYLSCSQKPPVNIPQPIYQTIQCNTSLSFTCLNIKMLGTCDKEIKKIIIFLLKLISVNLCNAFPLMWLHWKHVSWLPLFTEWRAQKKQNWILTYGPKTAFCNMKIAQLLHLICWILDRLQTSAKDLWEKKCDPLLSCPAGLRIIDCKDFGMFRTVSGLNFAFQGLAQRHKSTYRKEKSFLYGLIIF